MNLINSIKPIIKRVIYRNRVEIPAHRLCDSRLYKRGKDRSADPNHSTKIIGLMRVRNEADIIAFSVRALAQHTDAIIVFDDHSNDGTLEILQSLKSTCKIEAILQKSIDKFTESEDRNRLLRKGREHGGTHFVVIDADEALTSNLLEDQRLTILILGLNPGDTLLLNWIHLWRTTTEYRHDDSIWSGNCRPTIFCDDGRSQYVDEFIHFGQVPVKSGKQYILTGSEVGLLHFQFVNWRNLLVKQAWYRCLEKINLPDKSTSEINAIYAPSKDETGLRTQPVPEEWLNKYPFWDPTIFDVPETWREKQVLEWFAEYGEDFFADLDIWDIDWDYSKIGK